ncbi:hypothetical protein [Vibrio sinaloensis]
MNYQLTSLAASVLIALSMSANAANVDDFLVAVPLAHSCETNGRGMA